MTIKILDGKYCTGCSLCASVCPKNSITMVENEEGFLHPTVGENCIDCGLCAKKCPQLSKAFNLTNGALYYAVSCKDEIRSKCSSGGVFKALADKTLDNGGVVFGASMTEDFNGVNHIAVYNKKDLPKILGSKYVQSDVNKIYKQVKKELDNNREVLFCGCPCQVDALKTFLNKDYPKLLTVDILCHGVPSPKALRAIIKEKNPENKAISNVRFRCTEGWGYHFEISFADGTSVSEPWNGTYMSVFSSGINMRTSCYSCSYSQEKRVGDITLGDFWGVKKEWNDNKGTSFVAVNNLKGAKAIDKIKDDCLLFESVSRDYATETCKKANGALFFPTKEHSGHKIFFKHLDKAGFYYSKWYAEKALMDVGILGWWIFTTHSNYGSTLTAYALERYCSSLGLSVAFVSPPDFDRTNAGSFNKENGYRMTIKYPREEMWKNNQYFKSYIVGSDVLWYYDAMMSSAKYAFMLDFAGDNNRKISYSTSFGNQNHFFPKEAIPYATKLLNRFDFVSTRENKGVEILKEKFGVEGTQVVDPVFLCDDSVWQNLENKAIKKTQGDFVFAYFLDPNENKISAFNDMAKELNCPMVCATDRQYNPEGKAEMLKDCGVIPNMSLYEFIYHLRHAKYIMTDSFHGTCFSIIFRRNFYALPNKQRDTTRFDTLVDLFDVGDRMITDLNEFMNKNNKFEDMDYTDINGKIEYHVNRSKKWLDNALFSNIDGKNLLV